MISSNSINNNIISDDVCCRVNSIKNADKLTEKQNTKLRDLLENNANLNTLYILKEQLQSFWQATSFEHMDKQLQTWCSIADQTNMTYLKKFAKSLRKNRVGICNYATHPLTSARIEAGNVSIGDPRESQRN